MRRANLTDTSKNGKCEPSKVYKEVTLKGGINAGTYKDVGGVTTMDECQSKCCEFPACDLAFMLAGSCYLVGCYDQKNCAMQPAKESKFQPMISYVTRWNVEGVKHTVLLQEKGIQYVCSKMQPLTKVTLKDGLQAGDFTDVGKVSNLGQCYDVCCQQDRCDLAFMLGQNCFSVQCKDKSMCFTTPAQPSIFNPQIAYVKKRSREGEPGVAKSGNETADAATSQGNTTDSTAPTVIEKMAASNKTAVCPNTSILDKMTLKGGVDAGVYKDHGTVKSMDLCRRICCEMTECHLAFMLGTNCFSVKCASVDSCRALKAKPSSYYPKISYIRNVVSNQLLPSIDAKPAATTSTSLNSTVDHTDKKDLAAAALAKKTVLQKPDALKSSSLPTMVASEGDGIAKEAVGAGDKKGDVSATNLADMNKLLDSTTGYVMTASGLKPMKLEDEKKVQAALAAAGDKDPTKEKGTAALKSKDSKATVKSDIPATEDNKLLLSALEPSSESKDKDKDVANNTDCKPGILKSNVTLKGGRKAGEFIEIKGLSDMAGCVKRCCDDIFKKCNLAFMLGDTCYSVACKEKDLCATIPAPPTKFNPLIQYVRGLEEEKGAVEAAAAASKTKEASDSSAKTVDIMVDATKPLDTTDAAKLTDESSPSTKSTDAGKENAVTKSSDTSGDAKKTDSDEIKDEHVDETAKDIASALEKVKTEVDKDKTVDKSKHKSCITQPIVTGKSIQGGKKAGKFKIFRDIKDMPSCINKCCSLKKQCDVAYMEDNKCFSIMCYKKSACSAIDLRDTDINPKFAYMDHYLERVEEEDADNDITTDLDTVEDSACSNVEITKNKTLKGGTRAGKFHSMGKKNMKKCINECCGRPNCDIAYQLNGHCYSVECSDGKLCQATNEPTREGDNIQLAYMNKNGLNEKQRDYMVIYIIVGSLAFAATLGGLIWLVFAISKRDRSKPYGGILSNTKERKKMKKPQHKRLLDDDEEEEPIDDLLQKRHVGYHHHRRHDRRR